MTVASLAIEDLKFDERGLIPAIVQDARTGEVLTLAYMNRESLARTLETRETWFWSRSRNQLWHKGATSGHTQRVFEIRADCDKDALVVAVEPSGAACHTGAHSCFHNKLEGSELADVSSHFEVFETKQDKSKSVDLSALLDKLYEVIKQRREEKPAGSYTTYLFEQGLDKILKKVGEESAETIIAAKNEDASALVAETSDLLYHLIVLLVERDVTLNEVCDELMRREGKRREK